MSSASCVGFVVKSGYPGNRNLEPRINIMVAATCGPDGNPRYKSRSGWKCMRSKGRVLARMRRRKSTPVIGRKKQTQYLLKDGLKNCVEK